MPSLKYHSTKVTFEGIYTGCWYCIIQFIWSVHLSAALLLNLVVVFRQTCILRNTCLQIPLTSTVLFLKIFQLYFHLICQNLIYISNRHSLTPSFFKVVIPQCFSLSPSLSLWQCCINLIALQQALFKASVFFFRNGLNDWIQ